MNREIKYLSIIAIVFALTFSSCRRNREDLADTDTSLASKYSSLEQSNNDLDGLAHEIVYTNTTTLKTDESNSILSQCATITFNYKTADSVNAVIDFGSNNCLCADQKYRRGLVKIVYSKPGKFIALNTDNYFVNNNKIEATRNLKYILATYFVINSTCAITFADSNQTVSETATRTINWTEGNGTVDKADDVFVISGNSSGVNHNGAAYSVNITTPITRTGDCSYIKSGVVEIKPANKFARSINFGSGTCDNIATISIGKFSKIITLN
jgi:hypothetical protein